MKKVCLITGSTSGIGLATVREMSKECDVILNDYKDIPANFIEDNFENVQNVHFFRCDISNGDEILQLKKYILDNFGRLDYLVCNAGVLPMPCGIDEVSDRDMDKTIDVNLKGTFRCLRDLGGIIRDSVQKGSIVTISSIDGLIGDPYDVIYSATKAGVVSLTKSFARYFGENIRVNCIAPGIIDTPMERETDVAPEKTISVCVIKRIGQPNEIVNMIEFLLSDKASFITGQTIAVDGGFTLK